EPTKPVAPINNTFAITIFFIILFVSCLRMQNYIIIYILTRRYDLVAYLPLSKICGVLEIYENQH
ncbi:hypothetical protein, partial [Leyella stercorea]|uniref:hypothetical protein n=1 Tax=Leyella stercorea TaxID=363265 RepID=UPI00242F5156